MRSLARFLRHLELQALGSLPIMLIGLFSESAVGSKLLPDHSDAIQPHPPNRNFLRY